MFSCPAPRALIRVVAVAILAFGPAATLAPGDAPTATGAPVGCAACR